MPGLLTLRPLASAGKAAKSIAAKNAAVSAARADRGRDDARPQGQGRAVSPVYSRGRVLRAPAAFADSHPVHQLRHYQQQHGVLAQVQEQGVLAAAAGWTSTATKEVVAPKRSEGVYYSSSGSEHEPNSVCLAEMVFDYIEDDVEVSRCGRARCNCGNSCSGTEASAAKDNDDSMSSLGGEIAEVLKGLVPCVSFYESGILSLVSSTLSASRVDDREAVRSPSTRRLVMSKLRSSGYNAAICKSRWEHAGGFPGGDYEYIDVITEGGSLGRTERIIVDVDFKAQFEIARPTSLYSALVQSLPSVFIGKADRLQQIVNIMCDASKRSLKKKGLHLPPWRKPEYIKAKWFSSYRRTTNGESSSVTSPDNMDIGQIALRGAQWDSKFTTEMEKSFVKAADLKMALRQCAGEDKLDRKTLSQVNPADELEGKVRGANLMGFLGIVSNNAAAASDDDVNMATTWEPPSVIPRTSTQKAAGKKVGGLVSILKDQQANLLATRMAVAQS